MEKPAHVIVFNVSEKGHLHPTLAAVKEMTQRGTLVSYVVFPWTEDTVPYTKSVVEAQGAHHINLYDITSWRWTTRPGPNSNVHVAKETYQDVLKWISTLEVPPSAIMHDPFSLLGSVISAKLNLPLITSISNAPVKGFIGSWNSVEEMEQISKEIGVDVTHNAWVDPALPNSCNRALSIMHTVPPLVGHMLPAETVDKIHFAGSLYAARSHDEEPLVAEILSKREQGKKIWLISLGTVVVGKRCDEREDYRRFITHLFDTIAEVVSEREDVEAYGIFLGYLEKYLVGKELPKNFHACSFISQLQVIPHIDVFLTHAGANSFNEALLFGKPLIAVPFGGDQLSNSEAVERNGVGYYMRHDEGVEVTVTVSPERKSVNKENMQKALEFCLSDEANKKALEITKLFHNRTPQTLVDRIYSWIANHQ